MPDPIQLLHQAGEEDGAAATFDRVLLELNNARESVEIFMYVWRSDAIGNAIGRAVLDAAERGVKVHIIKDAGAILFERVEMNRKSFFNTKLPGWKSTLNRLIGTTFPDTCVEDDFGFEIGDALMAHPGVRLDWVNKTHTKYYVFDEKTILTGSINLEDRHRGYFDYMLALESAEQVQRMRSRLEGACEPDPGRPIEFYVNAHDPKGLSRFEIRPRLLQLIGDARESIEVEMAYLGDEAVTDALVAAAQRGLLLRFLFSPEANIGNEINFHTMRMIMQRAPVEVYFTPKMIHSKMMLFDRETVLMGSANLSVFSLQKAGEVDLQIREPAAASAFREIFADRRNRSRRLDGPEELAGYSQIKATLQQWHQKMNPN